MPDGCDRAAPIVSAVSVGGLDPRRARIRARALRKVEVLEGWALAGGVGAPARLHATRAAFRRWTDAGLGLEAWRDPRLDDDDGPFAELMRRRRAAVAAIRSARARPSRDDPGGRLAADDQAAWPALRAFLDATGRSGRPPDVPGRR